MPIDSKYITTAVHGSANDFSLKDEFDDIMAEYGWYVVLRSFDLTQHSQYYDEQAKEAFNGPVWEYTDYLVKARRVEVARLTQEEKRKFGDNYDLGKIFFLKSELTPKREDKIYTIQESLNEIASVPVDVHANEGYNIEEVERKIEHGLIFWKCYCTYLTPKNDETIEGGFTVSNLR